MDNQPQKLVCCAQRKLGAVIIQVFPTDTRHILYCGSHVLWAAREVATIMLSVSVNGATDSNQERLFNG